MRVSLARIGVLSLALSISTSYAEANDVKVTFLADPTGATLYEEVNGSYKLWGYTPLILKWQVPRKWSTCVALSPMKVRWVSGAEASITLKVCPQTGKNQQFVFQRPSGVPGAELDAKFAIATMRNATLAVPPPPAPIYIPHTTHCTSTVIGNQVFTNCY
jgi:hypothetical protein